MLVFNDLWCLIKKVKFLKAFLIFLLIILFIYISNVIPLFGFPSVNPLSLKKVTPPSLAIINCQ